MKMLLRILFICLPMRLILSSYCYWNTGCPYKYLSTETPYNSVRGDIRDSIVKLTGRFVYCSKYELIKYNL